MREKLVSHMPTYYRKSKVIENLHSANATELIRLDTKLDNVLNQFFVNSADYTLERYEQEYGIKTDKSYDIVFRRTIIISKKRGSGTVTPALIKNVAESFDNGIVDVIENNAAYEFTIKFIGTRGIPPNLDDLKRAIEDIKPAHLHCLYEFTYITWNDVEGYNRTFDEWDALDLTWDEFEAYGL